MMVGTPENSSSFDSAQAIVALVKPDFFLVFDVLFYEHSAWFLMKIFDKAGVQGRWRACVPVYNFMVFLKLGDLSPWLILIGMGASIVLGWVPVLGWLLVHLRDERQLLRIGEEQGTRQIGADPQRAVGRLSDGVVDVIAERLAAAIPVEEWREHPQRQCGGDEERVLLQRRDDDVAKLSSDRVLLR